jgi:hypothetical protein
MGGLTTGGGRRPDIPAAAERAQRPPRRPASQRGGVGPAVRAGRRAPTCAVFLAGRKASVQGKDSLTWPRSPLIGKRVSMFARLL